MKNELVNVVSKNGISVVRSRDISESFGKEHKEVIYAIEGRKDSKGSVKNYGLIDGLTDGGTSHLENYFIKTTYMSRGKEYKEYLLTRDGFTLLAMGFTGEEALKWKLKYIEAFNLMEESLKQAIPMLTDEQRLQLAIFQAQDKDSAVMASSELDRYRRKQLEEKQKEIDYKDEVLKGVTEDIDIYTKRNVLNKVVRYKGADFQRRWQELYDRFKEVHSIDLPARRKGYNLKQEKKKDELSIVKYAEKFGYLDDLYKIAVKLYATDIDVILKNLQKITA